MLLLTSSLTAGLTAKPITGPWPKAFPAKELCSNCGLCRSAVGVASVTEACAFLGDGMSRAEQLEERVHGRGRQYDVASDDLYEAHYGVHEEIVLARGFQKNAQWTGVATGVALAWLESGEVDAVVVAGSEAGASGFAAPKPVLCRTPAQVLAGRRVKPSLCPSLEVLDQVKSDPTIRRLLFCGVGCAVQALRAMGGASPEEALGLEAGGLFVLGTHCVDNSPTPEAAQAFVSTLPGVGEARANAVLAYGCMANPDPNPNPNQERANDVLAYEFMADFRVHARLREGEVEGGGEAGQAAEREQPQSVVKPAYMTLPPSIGMPSIADPDPSPRPHLHPTPNPNLTPGPHPHPKQAYRVSRRRASRASTTPTAWPTSSSVECCPVATAAALATAFLAAAPLLLPPGYRPIATAPSGRRLHGRPLRREGRDDHSATHGDGAQRARPEDARRGHRGGARGGAAAGRPRRA